MPRISTIGYEGATMDGFLHALRADAVDILVDVRAIASSRRPGFAKTRLAANLAEAGIEYVHLRGLGTPSDGRAAARAGRHEEMKAIYAKHLVTDVAQTDLATLASIVSAGERRACVMCFEADHRHCHRSLVVAALAEQMRLDIVHLVPLGDDE